MNQSAAAISAPKILLALHEPLLRSQMQTLLTTAGYTVAVAGNGAEAMDSCTRQFPDLALVDFDLPGEDGSEFCRRLRTMPDGRVLSIILVGEDCNDAAIHCAFAAGVDDIWLKPMHTEILLRRVRRMLAGVTSLHQGPGNQEELQLLREALHCLPVGITIADQAGRIRYANPAENLLHGYQPGELDGRLAAELGATPAPAQQKIEDLARRGPWCRDAVNRRKDGGTFPVRLHSATIKDEQGQVIGTVTSCEDLAPLQRMEQALRSSEAELRLLFDKSLDGLFFMMLDEPVAWDDECDREAVIDYVLAHQRLSRANQALLAQYGAGEEEMLGIPFGAFFGHDPEQGRRTVRTLLEQGQALIETEERRRDGTPLWVEGFYVCLYDEGGRVIGKFGAQRDVTARKQTERQLCEAKQRAEQAVRTKSEFLANMSHEIRTPLNGLLGMLQLLQMTPLDEEQQDYVTTAIYSGNSLLSVINDILEFSKIEAGKITAARIEFDLRQLIDNSLTVFMQQAVSKGLLLDWTLAADAPKRLCGDPGRIRQILFNLIGNAVKFTEQGRVLVTGEVHADPDRVGVYNLMLVVTDTGIGIPAQALPRIFEPFTQADGSHTRRHQGTGLGLSIVRKLLDHLGGTIEISSKPEAGTTVRCMLPLAVTAGAEVSETRTVMQRPVPAPPMTLLVVEDNSINRLLLKKQLEKLGHRVISAEGGQEALDLLTAVTPDALLLDIQMPGMDGLEVTRRLRCSPHHRSQHGMPIIALTAHAMPGDRERFLAAGMTGYLAKPVMLEELCQVLAECSAALSMALDSQRANV